MKKNIFLLSSVALMMAMTSCSDYFLNLDPTDTQTEANYYKTAAQFEAAANSTYSFYGMSDVSETVNGTKYTHTIYNTWDPNTDMGNEFSSAVQGTLAASQSDDYWGLCYAKIRKCNVVIEKAAAYQGAQSDIAASVATAKFFRAYQYFWLMRRFGGVPIVTQVLSTGSEELKAARNSRYEVMDLILSDLSEAIANLPEESAYDGHVTRQGAQAFKARVLLFEGTWEKYVQNTTDGDGVSSGAGSAKPAGYPSVENMLTEAASLADAVMSSGKYQLWNAEGTVYEPIAYWYLFNLEDENTNPMGYKKDQNKEFILQVAHDHSSSKIGKNITHSYGLDISTNPGSLGLKWMLTAPCVTDGLPYFYSKDYKGFDNMNAIFEDRDYRLTSQVLIPSHTYYIMGTSGADKTTYASADYVTTFNFPSGCLTFYPAITSPTATGFKMRKMTSERKGYSDTDESYNDPILRYAEVLLIYAEAKCELGGGTISDADLNKSINLLHHRAGTAPISNASVAQANANYQANTGQAGEMTILQLIRNERAIELICENQRGFDLMRWGIAETEMKHNLLGTVIKNPDGTDTQVVNYHYTIDGVEKDCFTTAAATTYGTETLPDGSQAYITAPASQVNMQRKHYLNPIPLAQIQLNENLLQNPGY